MIGRLVVSFVRSRTGGFRAPCRGSQTIELSATFRSVCGYAVENLSKTRNTLGSYAEGKDADLARQESACYHHGLLIRSSSKRLCIKEEVTTGLDSPP